MTDTDHAQVGDLAQGGSNALPPDSDAELARIVKLIRARPRKFQLLIVDCRNEILRDRLIEGLDKSLSAAGRHPTQLRLSTAGHPDFATVERALRRLAEAHDAIHLTGGPAWFDAARWEAFNIRRDAIAREIGAALLFWLDPESIATLARVATDLWSWRTAVIHFATEARPLTARAPDIRVIDDLSRGERAARIEFLRRTLREPDIPEDIRIGLAVEWGDLSVSIGQLDDAGEAYRVAAQAAIDDRSRAVVSGRIADILQARGQLDEALRIRREEQLPVYDRLGDV
ncbi:MAG: hypothetical protein ACP5NI_09645, partial [Acetobacteraceae bacterium]